MSQAFHLPKMPEIITPQQQVSMEMQPTSSVATQQSVRLFTVAYYLAYNNLY